MVAAARSALRSARDRREPKATVMTASLIGLLLLMAWFVAPPAVPRLLQALVGLVNATLAMLLVVFAAREYGFAYRKRRVLGYRLGAEHLLGGVLFVVVLCWWLSPWAPIKAQDRSFSSPAPRAGSL